MKVARTAVVEGKEATPPGPPWAGTPTCITIQPPAILHHRLLLCNAGSYPAVKHSGGDCGATLVGGPRRRPLAILTTLPRDAPCPSTVLVTTLAPAAPSCSHCTVCRNGKARKPMDTGAEYQSRPGAATPRSKPATSRPPRRWLCLTWITGRGPLCPACRTRPGVVRESAEEPALCAACFAAQKGWPSAPNS